MPPHLHVEALEISRHLTPDEARERWPELRARALVTASDAHSLGEIGQAVTWISAELAAARLGMGEWGKRLREELAP